MEAEIVGGPQDGTVVVLPDGTGVYAVAVARSKEWIEGGDHVVRMQQVHIPITERDGRYFVIWPSGLV